MFRLSVAAVLVLACLAHAADAPKETRLFELRVYTATKGNLAKVEARFKDHTIKLFEKHGITNIGYWVPIKNDEEKLYYIVAHKDLKSRSESFKNFGADPDWQKAQKESEKDGPIVAKMDSTFLTVTDYSPEVKPILNNEERVFELRTYTATKGNLDNLNARFRDHTLKLFEKYGMTNLYYFTIPKGNKGDDVMLIYLLAHKSEDAAKKSFDDFRKDESWIKARAESETKGGGSLTEKDGGVKSLFLKATDYSMTK
jgi:NIPSNAP